MLPESKLYSFIDDHSDIAIHFLEGQKLIHDLVLVHTLQPEAFNFLRDFALSSMPIISLLKGDEYLGLYIDSEQPYFRFKIETGFSGHMRTLILPEDFNEHPEKVTGICRITKRVLNKPGKEYTSIIDLKHTASDAIINQVLNDSFQMKSSIHLSSTSDQAILLSSLPISGKDNTESNHISTREYWLKNAARFNELFSKALTEPQQIIKEFSQFGCKYLAGREIQFHCPCSKEHLQATLINLAKSGHDLFDKDDTSLETKCDYCKKSYTFQRSEIELK